MTKPRQIHIPKEQRLQRIVDLLTPEGITNADIVRMMGFTARARPAVLLHELKEQGRVFGFGLGPHAERFFPDAVSCAAYAERLRAEIRERRAENCRRAQERYRKAGSKPKPKKQLHAEAEQAKEETAKRRKATRIEALKVITKAAGQLAPTTGTRTAAAPKPRGPAFVQGDPDISRARVTVLPTPRGRFEVDSAPSVINSRECRAWAREAVAA
jgi:hypothetical protein